MLRAAHLSHKITILKPSPRSLAVSNFTFPSQTLYFTYSEIAANIVMKFKILYSTDESRRTKIFSCIFNFFIEALKLLLSVSAVFGLKTFFLFFGLDFWTLEDALFSLLHFIFTKKSQQNVKTNARVHCLALKLYWFLFNICQYGTGNRWI